HQLHHATDTLVRGHGDDAVSHDFLHRHRSGTLAVARKCVNDFTFGNKTENCLPACHLTHPDLADCIHHVLALRDQNIDLPQLRDDLFRLVSLPCHCSPPGCQRHTSSRTTSMGVDQK